MAITSLQAGMKINIINLCINVIAVAASISFLIWMAESKSTWISMAMTGNGRIAIILCAFAMGMWVDGFAGRDLR